MVKVGHGFLDIFRERFGRHRRPHSKERGAADDDRKTEGAASAASANNECEAAAIAVLEDVIDSYNPTIGANTTGTGSKEAPNSGGGSGKVSLLGSLLRLISSE